MEVFITNLPTQGNISDKGLRDQLLPFIRNINVYEKAFDCRKPRGRNNGTITFLHDADGRKFLNFYGEIRSPKGANGRSRPRSQLHILGAHVLCRKSNKPADTMTLRHLEAEVDKAHHPPEPRRAAQNDTLPSFQINALHCGYYRFYNDRLAFIPEMTDRVIQGKASFGKRYLTVNIQSFYGNSMSARLMYIPLGTIQEIVWAGTGELTITLSAVPILFAQAADKKTRLTALDSRHAKIVGTCLIYRLDVDPTNMYRQMQRLSKLEILTITQYDLGFYTAPHIYDSMQKLNTTLANATAKNLLPFPILFQLQALAYNGYLHPDTVVELASFLMALRKTRMAISVEAMKTLFNDIEWPTPNYNNPSDFDADALISYLRKKEKDIQTGYQVRSGLTNPAGNLTPVCRVSVTPTRILLHGPELESKNRVLRKFPNHHDFFIRVQFCDENNDMLRLLGGQTNYDEIHNRFVEIMTNGIQIAGRTYKFLGWSHSSLRAHSMWFTAPFFDDTKHFQTHLNIINTLGNFNTIHSPARHAARIGQAFSETPFASRLDENKISVLEVPDVESSSGSVFSDGVGTISMEALMKVWKALPKAKMYPTCLQIRYAGAKGMLSLDMRLPGRQILLRPSMIKFESEEKINLEICDTAKAMPLYLNRQMIKILEDMYVPANWFIGLQNDAVSKLQLIASNTYNMASFLKNQGVATTIRLHKLLRLADKLGLDYRTEPFLRRTTEAVILRELRLLKQKARMPVPYGVTLFGVMDETGFLGPGEVYVTFESKANSKSQQFKSPPGDHVRLLVTRSPALHPGDIQIATNVIPPKGHPLGELVNCIAFSARGKRDLPSQLSGGDLDGDIFNVIWDRAVCDAPRLRSFSPAEYARVPPLDIGRPVTTEDTADFFINFMKADHLGVIATQHMILADQRPTGTLDPDCVAMAELHSTAVDFSKTGIPVNMKDLRRGRRFRPDFLAPGPVAHVYDRRDIELDDYIVDDDENKDDADMDGPAHKYYRSEKILGILYRAVDEGKIWNDDLHKKMVRNVKTEEPFLELFRDWADKECAAMGCYDWDDRVDEATRIRSAYEDSIRSTMHDYSDNPMQPITELEVVIGSLMSKTGAQSMRQRDRSHKLRDEFERITGWITGQMRPQKRDGQDLFASLRLCQACAHSEPLEDEERFGYRRKEDDRIQSFPLVAAATLLREIEYTKRRVDEEPETGGAPVYQLGLLRLH